VVRTGPATEFRKGGGRLRLHSPEAGEAIVFSLAAAVGPSPQLPHEAADTAQAAGRWTTPRDWPVSAACFGAPPTDRVQPCERRRTPTP